jgi:hypothetical protein
MALVRLGIVLRQGRPFLHTDLHILVISYIFRYRYEGIPYSGFYEGIPVMLGGLKEQEYVIKKLAILTLFPAI